MSKYTEKPKKTVVKVEKKAIKGEVIKKGDQEFIKCPKCGWIHSSSETKCRFCGADL